MVLANHKIDPSQPTRSAITVAGISGNSAKSARTRGSNAANDVVTGLRRYFGGAADATARATVDLPIAQLPGHLPLRNPVSDQPPDQRPIFH